MNNEEAYKYIVENFTNPEHTAKNPEEIMAIQLALEALSCRIATPPTNKSVHYDALN